MRQRRVQRSLWPQVAVEKREGNRGHGTEVTGLHGSQSAAQSLKVCRGSIVSHPAKREMRRKFAFFDRYAYLGGGVLDSPLQCV